MIGEGLGRLFSSLGATCASLAVACSGGDADPVAAEQGALSEGVVALVGSDPIHAETVGRIAAARKIDVRAARELAIADALFAAGARDATSPANAAVARRVALSRALLDEIAREARAKGPPNEREIAFLKQARWWELDRPELRRTAHAVIQVEKPEDDAKAKKVADEIAKAVQGIEDADEFLAKAKAVDVRGMKASIEHLLPVARDRRTVDPVSPPPPGTRPGTFDEDYVAAVYEMSAVGQQIRRRTKFGHHVILFTQLIPPLRPSREKLVEKLTEEIMTNRARGGQHRVLEELRTKLKVEVELAAAQLTAKVKVTQ